MLPRDLFIYGLASFFATHPATWRLFPRPQLAQLWLLPLLAILVTLSAFCGCARLRLPVLRV